MELTFPKDELSVGVKMLDCDHRVLFETIHELRDMAADEDPRRTNSLLRKLAQFTMTHFALEEGMMVATKYPGLARHRLNHQRIVERINALAAMQSRASAPLDQQSLSMLADLHERHIQSDDLHYGCWLNEVSRP
ncbi:MAG: bacteriohemerythrin [Terracidiphilus sp.]|jgi:hemerythrin-like metal-binding protein